MSITYSKVAEVLEAVANYVDEIEATKLATETAEKNKRLDKLAEKYESATGEAIPEITRNKFANLDLDALDHLIKVAQNNSGTPEALGRPTDVSDSVPRTIKEAATQANDNFLDWILGE